MPGWTRPSCPPALMRLTFQCGVTLAKQLQPRLREGGGHPTQGGLGKSPWRGDSSGGPRAGGIQPTEEGKLKARKKICSKSTWGHVGSSKPTRASLPTDYNRLWRLRTLKVNSSRQTPERGQSWRSAQHGDELLFSFLGLFFSSSSSSYFV